MNRLELETSIPSLESIKAQYEEIVPQLKKLNTKQDVINFGKTNKVAMEINYDIAEKFDESQEIKVVRCESWGDIDYVYVWKDNTKPMFDVWCDFDDTYFITDTNIDNLEKNYVEGVRWIRERNQNNRNSLFNIICILRMHGVEYNDIIQVYGFDSAFVEEYESNHYEWGYGDKED